MFFSVFTKGPPYGKNSKSWDFQENRYEEIFFPTPPPPIFFFVSNNQLLIGPKPMITVHKICPLIFVTKVVTKMGLPGCILKDISFFQVLSGQNTGQIENKKIR